MSNNDSSLNNKFGHCGCPALMSDKGRLFTNYTSSRLFNDVNSKNMNALDSHSYREKLQNNPNLRLNEFSKVNSFKCKSDSKNSFYTDSSKFTFDKPLTDAYMGQVMVNDGKLKKSDKANF